MPIQLATMTPTGLLQARANPSNWSITNNNGTTLTATNNVTGEVLTGITTASFNALLAAPVNNTSGLLQRVETQTATAAILPSSGTVATAGVVTLNVALGRIYAEGAWLYLPAGAVVGGAAGLYWTVFSSTTVGQVTTTYVDPTVSFASGIPTANLVNAVGSNSAYVTPTSIVPLINLPIPGTSISTTDKLNLSVASTNLNSAGAKTVTLALGASTIVTSANTTVTSSIISGSVINRGVTGAQVIINSANTVTYGSLDTTQILQAKVSGTLVAVTDYLVIESVITSIDSNV
jgi:hypothetical protein